MSATISEMYRRSGGCDYKNRCNDCDWLLKVKAHNRNHYKCLRYGDGGLEDAKSDWRNNYTACKFFKERVVVSTSKQDNAFVEDMDGQMSIFDLGME